MSKQFTRDISQLLADMPVERVAVFGYRASIDRLVQRYLYAKSVGDVSATLVIEPTDEDYDLAFVVSDEAYRDLPVHLQGVKHGIFYGQAQADMILPARQALTDSDWQVIRELERQFLADTALSQQREALRQEVDSDIANKHLAD